MSFDKYNALKERCTACKDGGATTEDCRECPHNAAIKQYEAESERNVRLSPYERTRNAVYATGNKWAIENFHATHD